MMKKVAIVTIQSNNFGNRLQNYALQEVLKKMGLEVETIRREKVLNLKELMIKKVKESAHFILQTKPAKFDLFNKNIVWSKWHATADDAQTEMVEKYDFFICGSDQVWNPYYKFVGKSDLLYFAPSYKKISYAASFGVNEVSDKKKSLYRELLLPFKAISVREEQGKKIVYELTGRNASVVLDPTMLLEQSDWKKLERKPSYKIPSEYVLLYALGEKSDEFERTLSRCAQSYQVFDVRKRNTKGKEIAIGPAEFLYLIDHAQIIMTDSFHATVFSLLYHKKVMTFKRKGMNMNSRIVSLAKILNLQDRMDEDGNFILVENIDFNEIDDNLKIARKDSIEFLSDALNEG